MAVRCVHDGINFESGDIALPVQDPPSLFNLDSSSEGWDKQQRYAIQEGGLVGVLG